MLPSNGDKERSRVEAYVTGEVGASEEKDEQASRLWRTSQTCTTSDPVMGRLFAGKDEVVVARKVDNMVYIYGIEKISSTLMCVSFQQIFPDA